MEEASLWLALVAAGALTFAQRLSFIVGWERLTLPPLARRALRFVPVAVLAALIFPDLLLSEGRLALSPGNDRLVAGAVAVLIAWRTRNMLLTIGVGMALLFALQRL